LNKVVNMAKLEVVGWRSMTWICCELSTASSCRHPWDVPVFGSSQLYKSAWIQKGLESCNCHRNKNKGMLTKFAKTAVALIIALGVRSIPAQTSRMSLDIFKIDIKHAKKKKLHRPPHYIKVFHEPARTTTLTCIPTPTMTSVYIPHTTTIAYTTP